MSSPVRLLRYGRTHRSHRAAYTLVEIITATALCLVIMGAVTTLIGSVTQSIAASRVMIENSNRLRSAQIRLQSDLRYHTARMVPPLRPQDDLGYFEILEGPGPFHVYGRGVRYVNSELAGAPLDLSVGDNDDVLMWTARSYGEPFYGRVSGPFTSPVVGQSQVAEIAYFVRGTTLYRRVLLVLPRLPDGTARPALNQVTLFDDPFYQRHDISVRHERWPANAAGNLQRYLIPNSLGDLTNRQNRYAHFPFDAGYTTNPQLYGYPHDVRQWGMLGLPTLLETSHDTWTVPFPNFTNPNFPQALNYVNRTGDIWLNPLSHFGGAALDPNFGTMQQYSPIINPPTTIRRLTEDVILTNVVGFDVQVWDPLAPVFQAANGGVTGLVGPGDGRAGNQADEQFQQALLNWANAGFPLNAASSPVSYGAYVNLYWMRNFAPALFNGSTNYLNPANGVGGAGHPVGHFAAPHNPASRLSNGVDEAAVWDTWSTHYETDGIDNNGNGIVDELNDGVDNNNNGIVDDASESEAPPPYAAPIRSLRVKIRIFEPDSRQIREVTVEQDFAK